MIKHIVIGCLLTAGFINTAKADAERWFEIEMIVFSQTPPAGLQEQFDGPVIPIRPGRSIDLLTPRFQPPIRSLLTELADCPQPAFSIALAEKQASSSPMLCIFETQPAPWQLTDLLETRKIDDRQPYPNVIPAHLSGVGEHQNVPYLADEASLQLTDIAKNIQRQAGNTLLLHTAWRQAPVTERRAVASHWYAGKNLSKQFDYWGQPIASHTNEQLLQNTTSEPLLSINDTQRETDVIQSIEQLLQQLNANPQLPAQDTAPVTLTADDSLLKGKLPDQVWQLDGLFKLHLDHYLFVNTEFNYRVANAGTLNNIYVKQSRRVISGEIHYLDHPYLGIILQIRRYEPPLDDGETTELLQAVTN